MKAYIAPLATVFLVIVFAALAQGGAKPEPPSTRASVYIVPTYTPAAPGGPRIPEEPVPTYTPASPGGPRIPEEPVPTYTPAAPGGPRTPKEPVPVVVRVWRWLWQMR